MHFAGRATHMARFIPAPSRRKIAHGQGRVRACQLGVGAIGRITEPVRAIGDVAQPPRQVALFDARATAVEQGVQIVGGQSQGLIEENQGRIALALCRHDRAQTFP